MIAVKVVAGLQSPFPVRHAGEGPRMVRPSSSGGGDAGSLRPEAGRPCC